ncbi:PAS domain-containing sensor histidine kinase [Rufibacter immobilis]|uniref:PAS domain-containing sensor histidine kinase n=1 Tax=Rufibacter immobilis TaxID=1348778 RepID=UPI0035E4E642
MRDQHIAKLREKAEKLLRLVTVEEAAGMSAEEVRVMIQELQIYQIELEMQNRQLEQTATELELSRRQYEELYDSAPAGYFTLDQNGVIVEANLTGASLLGVTRLNLLERRFSQFVHQESSHDFYNLFLRAKEKTVSQRAEIQMVPQQGTRICAQVELLQIQKQETPPLFRLVFLDITERKKTDEALKKHEQLLSSIIESSINGIQVFKAVRNSKGEIIDFEWLLMNHVAETFMNTSYEALRHTTLAQEAPEEITSGRFVRYVQVVEQGQPQTFTAHIKKGTKEYWLNLVAVKMEDGFVLTSEDVTEQHQVHEQLKESQHLMKTMAEAMPDFLYVEDLQLGRNIYNNRNFLAFLGYTPADIKGHPRELLDTLYHPEDASLLLNRKSRCANLPEGEYLQTHTRIKAKDGSWRNILFRDTVFKRDAHGQPTQLVGVAMDITERLRNTQELLRKQATINGLLNNLPIILWRISPTGIIEEATGLGLKSLGHQDQDLVGKHMSALNQGVMPHIQNVLTGGKATFVGELEVEGQKVYKQNFFLHDPLTGGAIGFCLDVTEQKKAEAEASWRNYILDQLIQKLPMVLAILDHQGNYVEARGEGLRRLGIADNELVGQNLFTLFPELTDMVDEIKAGKPINFIKRIDHQGKHTHFQNFGLFDPAQEFGIAFAIDITELIDAQEEVKQEKEFSENLLENSIDGILSFDHQFRITAWNKTMEQIMSVKKEQALGTSLVHLFPKQVQALVRLSLKKVLQGNRLTVHEIPHLHTSKNYEINLLPFPPSPEQKVTGALGIIHDITLERQRQHADVKSQLHQQKLVMNAVLSAQEEERKRIAEGLHNSLAQLLYAAKLNLEDLILRKPIAEPDAGVTLQRINMFLEDAIKETRTLAHELIPKALQDFGLKVALKDLSRRLSTDQFNVQCIVTGFNGPADSLLETALFRIVQELLNNSMKHALATEVVVQVVDKGTQIMVRVEDNGIGMDTSNPSFKGMGLATIQNRVKHLQGTMDISSAPGEGTVVTITLGK